MNEKVMISVVITTKNEEKNMRDLLDSLIVQAQPFEVIIVDADSKDSTRDIVKEYERKYNVVKLFLMPGTRGKSMNYGVAKSKGDLIAFLGADCIAEKIWLEEIRKYAKEGDIIMGKIIHIGTSRFKDLGRVELYHKGYEITFPGCNTTYNKKVFEDIGGFDTWFIGAEDIDLNYRAVSKDYKIVRNENAIIYHKAKDSLYSFLKQAFWNGYCRKQLTLKHGPLWSKYNIIEMVKINPTENLWKIVRLVTAAIGYIFCKISIRKIVKET